MSTSGELTMTLRSRSGESTSEEIPVISEHLLTVIINEHPAYRMVCTKEHLKELVVGRLLTEGLIRDAEEILKLYFCKYENEASVFLTPDLKWEELLRTEPTCCAGNKVLAAPLRKNLLKKLPDHKFSPDEVFALTDEFKKDAGLHDRTGGSHICILAVNGRTEFVCEDIGRHNAVDKAVGHALLQQIPREECMLFTSGRVPVDMVEKVIAAGIPVLISKSVPTLESAELAKDYGLTLICKAWPDRYAQITP